MFDTMLHFETFETNFSSIPWKKSKKNREYKMEFPCPRYFIFDKMLKKWNIKKIYKVSITRSITIDFTIT